MSQRDADRGGVRVSLTAPVDGLDPIVVEPDAGAELAMADAERGVLRSGDGADPIAILLLSSTPSPGRAPGIIRREVVVGGWRIEVDIESASRAALRERASREHEEATHSGPAQVRAIIPGVVVAVSVAAGDSVVAGQKLLIVEAMKMQNELRAPRDGTVEQVAVGPGVKIEVGDVLLVLS